MKTRLLLAGAVTAMASTALMADQVPDLLKFEGGDIYDHTIQVEAITTFTLDAANRQVLLRGDNSRRDILINMLPNEASYKPALDKAYLTWRDSRKLPTVQLNAETSAISGRTGNDLHVEWFPVEGASGYEVRAMIYDDIRATMTTNLGVHSCDFIGMPYDHDFKIEIRALSPEGEEFNSEWCSRSDISMIPWNNLRLGTMSRYPVPTVATVSDCTDTSFRVNLHLSYAESGDDATKSYSDNFQIDADGNFVADRLRVVPVDGTAASSQTREASESDWSDYAITDADRAAGYVDVTGLREGTRYMVTLVNSNVASEPDAAYNTLYVWTTANLEPILIPHQPTEEYDACLIDEILNGYTSDTSLPEGQVYWLEGGKAYCISQPVNLAKGLKLETRPEDVAAGLKATVYLGGISADGGTTNFMLGRQAQAGEGITSIEIGDIAFRNLDFDCPLAVNYGMSQETGASATGNYFANMYSNGLGFTISSLTFDGCSFRNLKRGFIRLQGNYSKVFNKITVDGCLFSDCGYYDKNGRGYAWFASDGKQTDTNMFADLTFSNNTIYDSPMDAMFTDGTKELGYAESVKWNIKVYNNTFFNFSTRTSGRFIFNMRYVPSGSHISFERNLIVQAAAEGDARPLNLAGADIRSITGAGQFSYTVKDNYSVASRAANQGDDRVFMGGAFSATKNSFGMFPDAALDCTAADLVVKQLTAEDGHAITPEELFNNPDPQYTQYDPEKGNSLDHAAPADIMQALSYKTLPAVITEKNIGDPRWRNTVTESEPILIPHQPTAEYDACLIDEILNGYTSDTSLPEGQVYWLEGGKAYCISQPVNLAKGLKLETRPEDVAAGLKATVYLGGIGADGRSYQFMLGRMPENGENITSIEIGDIAFRNLDFDCPLAVNYGKNQETGASATGNYFANMYSNALGFTINSLTFEGCSFRNITRGFLRLQGNYSKVFNKITVDGCLFSDCGYYDKNGRGYAWFASDGKQTDTNMFADVTFSNNTIYDSPMDGMFTDGNKKLDYAESVKWNIKVYNNTFFNFSTRAAGRYIFNLRYVPSGSHISFERNLIVQAAAEGDSRPLNLAGADIRERMGAGEFSYTVKDNYSVASRAANQGDDRVFTSGAFSDTRNSFGMFRTEALDCTAADLVVKQLTAEDGHAITPEELFNNPDPQYTQYDPEKGNSLDHAAPADIMEALRYKTLPAVITEKNIGDSRWR